MYYLTIEFQWLYLIYGLVIFLIFVGVRFVLNIIRKRTLNELDILLYQRQNFYLYHELLNNKRLKWIFTKNTIAIMNLKGYLLAGDEELINQTIKELDQRKLEPYEKLDYYQKRFSYFVSKNNQEEASQSLEHLKKLFKKKNEKTQAIIDEAELIYHIYLLHDTSLIPTLIDKANNQSDPIMRGITEYRLAKLYYYANNSRKVEAYLEKAKENVQGTYWYPIVIEALRDHSILAIK